MDIFDPPFDALNNDYDAYADFPSSPTLPPSSEATSNHSSDDDCLSTNGAPSPKSHLQVPFPPLKQTSLTSFGWKKLDPQQKAEQLSKISLQMKETTALRKAQEDDRKKRKDDERRKKTMLRVRKHRAQKAEEIKKAGKAKKVCSRSVTVSCH